MKIDLSDMLAISGAVLLAAAVGLGVGWVGLLAYAGALALTIGLFLARRQGSNRHERG